MVYLAIIVSLTVLIAWMARTDEECGVVLHPDGSYVVMSDAAANNIAHDLPAGCRLVYQP